MSKIKIGIPSLGFGPMPNTSVLFHSNDEYLNVETFLSGIDAYKKIILKLANVE